ncbi:deoxyribose-phosphate aldolase [Kribbia dieselivorans]|uniref:deoxyribose-phosphate aldolase n=1 Tax=Kribbia dieselivorans TaxID=331526 RepID=UPI000837F35C|nr:deoxyribose-phosphate aldolase [Kribbia dieselivorans]
MTPDPLFAPGSALTAQSVADLIDHAILKPDLTSAEVLVEINTLRPTQVWSVCVRPCDIPLVTSHGWPTKVTTVIGFPHGYDSTQAKVAEAEQALADGATEIDMVVNIGWLRGGEDTAVRDDITAVVDAASRLHVPVKVILETAYLDNDMIIAGCRAAADSGAAFVKTSTGFAGGGATRHDVALMRESVPEWVGVKASGGVRDLDTLLDMVAVGATRIGTSSSLAILHEASRRAAEGRLVMPVRRSDKQLGDTDAPQPAY